jgi:CheY-like chemotaxis protein
MPVDVGPLQLKELREYVERNFRQVAESKKLDFAVELAPELPASIQTDAKRLQQVLKNLLANAFKFTEKGGVSLQIGVARRGWTPEHPVLSRAPAVAAFVVTDTGIGIPKDKHQVIFEAFQQADGTTSRKYGGTGLGLSISREIARLLGGEIALESAPGEGSRFTLFVPLNYMVPDTGARLAAPAPPPHPLAPRAEPPATVTIVDDDAVADDRGDIGTGDRVLLIVEDDLTFARILLEMARARGFKGIATARAESALQLARQHRPDAITLDLRLPDGDGWTVLDRLKHDSRTRHIPVHIISVDEDERRGLQLGAIAYLRKPVSKDALESALGRMSEFVERIKTLLIVEDDESQRKAIMELIGDGDVQTTAVSTGEEALQQLKAQRFDCMVLDLGLPDMSGFELLERIKQETQLRNLPIVIYTGKELTPREETELRRVAEAIVVKDARSPERLLDETALFLHRVEANLPEPKRRMIEQSHQSDPILAGRKVLIVDDDVRNIFALTTVLERHRMDVRFAESGKEAISMLQGEPGIEVVLMDIMMPEMDGYEAMRAIRVMDRFARLPIIALTAKAMKDDREKCIAAGASDYISKPVDLERLTSLLRVWLYR